MREGYINFLVTSKYRPQLNLIKNFEKLDSGINQDEYNKKERDILNNYTLFFLTIATRLYALVVRMV